MTLDKDAEVESMLPVEAPDHPPQHDPRSAIPIQFRLRSLLILIALCSVWFAAVTNLDRVWAAVLLMITTLGIAHVTAAVIGTSLRGQAPRRVSPHVVSKK
ncbi:MAG: hypothetical protein DWQ31_05575 [Planctomycetota bacterium]|nr:MAG: hypothetical protein DWQ31_05575 [Planctomycetota bacterium]REJ92982.1 MAG: hypothetical protein DWQ35_11125 [Planctomycetota bacterium]REK30592.1 MAG: hypothetical protein DWQ42_01755 [Planctomycetota bacterium]REK46016.1 MAG: hypothetical protein DWQ46_07585 [Planctomycetota bacterium]